MWFHQYEVAGVHTSFLESEVLQQPNQVVVPHRVRMDEEVRTSILGSVSKRRLEKQFADFPTAHRLTHFEGAELQCLTQQSFARIVDFLVTLGCVNADRRESVASSR